MRSRPEREARPARDDSAALAHALREARAAAPPPPAGLVARLQHGVRARRHAGDGSTPLRVVVAALLFVVAGRDASPRALAVAAACAVAGALVLVPRPRGARVDR